MAVHVAHPISIHSSPSHCNIPFPARAALMRIDMATEMEQVPLWFAYLQARQASQRISVPSVTTTAVERGEIASQARSTVSGESSDGESGVDGHREQAAAPPDVTGKVMTLSRDPVGCRQVQQALDEVTGDKAREAIALELKDHVWEALRCPHANHVLQKCVSNLKPQAAQFIINELTCKPGWAAAAACHKFGCRVLQRLLEHCSAGQNKAIIEDVLSDALQIARHPYGNYVVQHILEHGTFSQYRRLTKMLELDIAVVALDSYGCAVVNKALSHGEAADQRSLALSLLHEPGVLVAMSCTRHGHLAVKLVLQVLEGEEREEARAQLARSTSCLRASRYGRQVAAFVQPSSGGLGTPDALKPASSNGCGASSAGSAS